LICIFILTSLIPPWKVLVKVIILGILDAWMDAIIVNSIRKLISKKDPAHSWLKKELIPLTRLGNTRGQLFFKQTRPESNQDKGAICV